MSEDRVRELLDNYTNAVFPPVLTYIGLYFIGIILVWMLFLFLRRNKHQSLSRRSAVNYDISVGPSDAILGITNPNMPAVAPPEDGRYFQTVLAYAQMKMTQGKPLMRIERTVMAEFAFLNRLLVTEGVAMLDDFTRGLPHKDYELRQVLQEIGAKPLADPVGEVVATYLHREQVIQELAALGAPREEALQHPELPSYDDAQRALDAVDAPNLFLQQADQFIANKYAWGTDRAD
ncbi:hypothetical protein [Yoonia sp. BS5-3]|uniref:DUF4375 domain-containing protein n=1 Tax=Yoonia phaeophyticola TaxID=3137369 RepID=A0ABZ2V199_9RHOB